MIASLPATGVAVAGTGLPATATVPSPVRSMFHGSYEPPKNPEHDAPIHGIPSDLARDGAVVFVLLHEIRLRGLMTLDGESPHLVVLLEEGWVAESPKRGIMPTSLPDPVSVCRARLTGL